MLTRILVAIVLITLVCACTSTPGAYSGTHASTRTITQRSQQARWEEARKCELMILASNEPDKSQHIASRCHRPW